MTTADYTPEQKAAWQRLTGHPNAPTPPPGVRMQEDLEALAPLLPDGITGPDLPTEAGWYLGFDRVAVDDIVLRFDEYGKTVVADPERFAPFRRLQVAQPALTRADLHRATLAAALASKLTDQDVTDLHRALTAGDTHG